MGVAGENRPQKLYHDVPLGEPRRSCSGKPLSHLPLRFNQRVQVDELVRTVNEPLGYRSKIVIVHHDSPGEVHRPGIKPVLTQYPRSEEV